MPYSKNPSRVPTQISILLFDRFSNHCLANVLEPLRAANDLSSQQVFEWNIVVLGGQRVRSSSGLRLEADAQLADMRGDILMVMPSYGFLTHANVTSSRALRAAARRFDILAGLDTGSWLLAEAGLLDGYRATIHWDELDRFSERFSDIDVQKEAVIYDRDRITCGGASTAFALAMQMIEKQHGAALRLRVEHLFSGAYAQRPVRRGGIAARAVDLMRAHIEEPLQIAQLAQQLGRSQKHLEQQMLARLGAAPQVIYRRIRLERARQLSLDTTISVAEISVRCGYQDASAMTRAFRSEYGTTPQALRRASS
ncbi:helix-turn-helix domain-containing protein [uncultured Planktomarina sp.]|jgi:transcriptional regulator GlxA family with amidase domain|uniref:GlxA family transcriptional regulator n=1 Tax=uncultured Planktomarina sp. TaxID=1538529 RepID=UPI0032605FCE